MLPVMVATGSSVEFLFKEQKERKSLVLLTHLGLLYVERVVGKLEVVLKNNGNTNSHVIAGCWIPMSGRLSMQLPELVRSFYIT